VCDFGGGGGGKNWPFRLLSIVWTDYPCLHETDDCMHVGCLGQASIVERLHDYSLDWLSLV